MEKNDFLIGFKIDSTLFHVNFVPKHNPLFDNIIHLRNTVIEYILDGYIIYTCMSDIEKYDETLFKLLQGLDITSENISQKYKTPFVLGCKIWKGKELPVMKAYLVSGEERYVKSIQYDEIIYAENLEEAKQLFRSQNGYPDLTEDDIVDTTLKIK